jgi:hypothetical protein
MEQIKTKEDLINLLLKYLPEVSNSLNVIIKLSHGYLENRETGHNFADSIPPDGIRTIVEEVDKIIGIIKGNNDNLKTTKYTDPEMRVIVKMYFETADLILEGFLKLYSLLTNGDNSDEEFDQFINSLYKGAQQIMELVNVVVEE